LHIEDEDFKKVVEDPSLCESFTLQEGFLFKENKVCIPKNPLRNMIVKEAYEGALIGHFGINNTLEILKEHFYCHKMGGDVHKVISRCATCHLAKSHFHQGLYTPLPAPSRPWDDISMDFIVAFPQSLRGKDDIMLVVDQFPKMAYFITYHKRDDVMYIVDLFF